MDTPKEPKKFKTWKPEDFDEKVKDSFQSIMNSKVNTPAARRLHRFLKDLIVTIRVNSEATAEGEVVDKNPDCGLMKFRQPKLQEGATPEEKAATKVWDPFARRVILGGQQYFTTQTFKPRGLGILKDTYKVLRLYAQIAEFPKYEVQQVKEAMTKKSMGSKNFRCSRESMSKLMAIKNGHK